MSGEEWLIVGLLVGVPCVFVPFYWWLLGREIARKDRRDSST